MAKAKASIESAILGLGQLRTALRDMEDWEAEEIFMEGEAGQLDTMVWNILEAVQTAK